MHLGWELAATAWIFQLLLVAAVAPAVRGLAGGTPLSQWSAFQNELQSKGSSSFMNIFTTAYNTYNSAHPGA